MLQAEIPGRPDVHVHAALKSAGFIVQCVREGPSFVEAEVSRAGDAVLMQGARDSAFRFFPLAQHQELGLALHPFDLATNKVLALIGRLEARDWIDVIECDRRPQPLGYLAWAACGKDPGFGPAAILEHAARTARYTQVEIDQLSFAGDAPDATELSRRWHAMLDAARHIAAALPVEEAGKCALTSAEEPYRGTLTDLHSALRDDLIIFRPGRIHAALPQLVIRPRSS
jgi:hypothetical protein